MRLERGRTLMLIDDQNFIGARFGRKRRELARP